MVEETINRFDIYLVKLNPTIGSEIQKTRPCIIISPKEMNVLNTLIVAPMTSKGFDFIFPDWKYGMSKDKSAKEVLFFSEKLFHIVKNNL